jgi:hypothetical protein
VNTTGAVICSDLRKLDGLVPSHEGRDWTLRRNAWSCSLIEAGAEHARWDR